MPNIYPFKAVRPTRDKVSLVASRSYESYTQEERDARLRDNPFSFLHIVNPGFKYHKEITGTARYQLVKNRYLEFKEDGVFQQDEKQCLYVYKIVNRDGNVFHGLVAATSIEDYEKDLIKKHEDTLSQREAVFKEYLKTVGFNSEAVLLTYPDDDSLKDLLESLMEDRPEYEFTTTYRDTHYLWAISEEKTLEKLQSIFEKIPAFYIADGHHRSASSYLLAKDLQQENASPLVPEHLLEV